MRSNVAVEMVTIPKAVENYPVFLKRKEKKTVKRKRGDLYRLPIGFDNRKP